MPTEVPIYLIGFKILATSDGPVLYTLVYGDDDAPLLQSGRIAFFERVEQAMEAFALLPARVRRAGTPPSEVAYTYDLPFALGQIASAEIDPSRQLLNCLNVTFDLVKALRVDLPAT